MDVNKLQKINMLASELKKHSGASTIEAAQQAQEVFQAQQMPNAQNAQPQTASQPQTMKANQPAAQQSQEPDMLAQKQFEFLLSRVTKKYDEQLELFRNGINTLATELESVKAKLSKLQSIQPKEVQVPLKKPEPKKETAPAKKEAHPRQGNFSSTDVDIQKMFYFGSKR